MKTKDFIPLIPETKKMGDAIIEISSKGFGCVGIVSKKNKHLIGMITDGDLRRNMKPELLNKKVTQVMTKNPKTLNQNTLIQDALILMNNESITNFFITEKKRNVIRIMRRKEDDEVEIPNNLQIFFFRFFHFAKNLNIYCTT